MTHRRKWTEVELDVLVARYPHERTENIARDLGRDLRGVYQKAKTVGLKKSPAFLASEASGRLRGQRGVATRFVKGQAPPNKGLRRPGWGPGRMKATQFKKGENPHTWVPIGTERVRDGYRWRKTRDDQQPSRFNWQLVHHVVWIEANGPIPSTHRVVFVNGDATDLRLENLACVSKAEHVKRVGLHRLPQELIEVIQLRGAITRQLNKRQPPVKPKIGRPSHKRNAA
jgi:hypothetical protein